MFLVCTPNEQHVGHVKNKHVINESFSLERINLFLGKSVETAVILSRQYSYRKNEQVHHSSKEKIIVLEK